MESDNPLAFLGLQRVTGENSPSKMPTVELNNRGLPARKRKKNSLIFGEDEVVAIPVRTPRKKSPMKEVSSDNKTNITPKKVAPSPTKQPSSNKKSISAQKVSSSANSNNTRRNTRTPVKKRAIETKQKEVLAEDAISENHSEKIEVHINSNDVRRLARIELDSLLEEFATSTGAGSEDEFDAENSDTEPEDSTNSYIDDEGEKMQISRMTPVPVSTQLNNIVDHKSEEQTCQSSPDEEKISALKRLNAQRLGVALRNLLKLPKAHKWVCFEFFYSDIDKVLFCSGENDFIQCLRESFPNLKTRRLTRVQWCKVRRLMGKPRRCSHAFFEEERRELERKRDCIRSLQHCRIVDSDSLKILPTEDIPMQLTIGAKVTARLRSPQDGLYCGTVDAVDPNTSTYRITFDRAGLGTHSIPDYEVLSLEAPDLLPVQDEQEEEAQKQFELANKNRYIPLSSLAGSLRATGASALPSPAKFLGGGLNSPLTNDPLLSGAAARNCTLRMDQLLGGYPVRYLYNIVKLNKCLKLKREKISALKNLNTEAELRKSYGALISEDYQKKYASTVIDVYKINQELNSYLRDVSTHSAKLGNIDGPSLSLPDQIRDNCQEEAYVMVNRFNCQSDRQTDKQEAAFHMANSQNDKLNITNDFVNKLEINENNGSIKCEDGAGSSHGGAAASVQTVQSPKLLALISQISCLMLQVKRVSVGETNVPVQVQALKDSVASIKSGLNPNNAKVFEDTAEVHMDLIQQQLSKHSNLAAFNTKEQQK